MASEDNKEHLQIADYLRIARKRKFAIINCIVLLVVMAGVYSYKMRPVYLGTVRILIERMTPQAVQIDPVLDLDGSNRDFYKTQHELLRSRSLVKAVIQNVHLEESDELAAKPPSLISIATLKAWFKAKLVAWGIKEKSVPVPSNRDPYSPLITRFLSRLTIAPTPNSRLVDIGWEGYTPNLVAEVANSVAEMYILKNIELQSAFDQGAGDWLEDRISEIKRKVRRSEQALQRFRERKNIVEFEENRDITSDKLSQINAEVTRARGERIRLQTLGQQLVELQTGDPVEMLNSIPDSVKSEVIKNLQREFLLLQTEHAENSKKFGPKHPTMIEVSQRINIIKNRIPEEINRLVKSVEIDYKTTLAREASMLAALEEQKAEVQNLNKESIQYNALQREADSNKRLYEVLLNRLKETDVSAKFNESNIRVVDPSEVPAVPIRPKMVQYLAIGFGFGMFFGIMLALFLESVDKTLRNVEEVERQIPFPFLGAIGYLSRKDGEMPIANNTNSQRAEEFRMLRTNLLHAAPDNKKQVLMITSTTPREGKSTVVANLGIALAQLGKNVLIVDADLRKSRLHALFNTRSQPGLIEVIFEHNNLEECIHKTDIKGVWILPRGTIAPNTSEILSSNKFKNLMLDLRDNFDMVLVDAPPVLHISDASIVTRYCDGVVFVIKSGANHVKLVQRAVNQISNTSSGVIIDEATEDGEFDEFESGKISVLPGVSSKVLGVVLNRVAYEKDGYYGYYGKYDKSYYGYNPKEMMKEERLAREDKRSLSA